MVVFLCRWSNTSAIRTEIKTRIEKEQENISQMLKEADESNERYRN